METLIMQFVTTYGGIVAAGCAVILFLLSGQQRNKADIEWLAWDSVRDFALIVESCNVPHTALIEKIQRVQERFDARNNDTPIMAVLKGVTK